MRILKCVTKRRGATRQQCLALLACGVALAAPFKLGLVRGTSMEPTLAHGQMYVLDRTHYLRESVKRGDVLVFRKEGVAYVKRVVAVPGDTIYLLRHLGESGEDTVVTSFQLPKLKRAIERYPWARSHKLIRRRIPAGHYYVLGDHRAVSIDSRQFGLVTQNEILGHVLFVPNHLSSGEALAGRFVPQPRS